MQQTQHLKSEKKIYSVICSGTKQALDYFAQSNFSISHKIILRVLIKQGSMQTIQGQSSNTICYAAVMLSKILSHNCRRIFN